MHQPCTRGIPTESGSRVAWLESRKVSGEFAVTDCQTSSRSSPRRTEFFGSTIQAGRLRKVGDAGSRSRGRTATQKSRRSFAFAAAKRSTRLVSPGNTLPSASHWKAHSPGVTTSTENSAVPPGGVGAARSGERSTGRGWVWTVMAFVVHSASPSVPYAEIGAATPRLPWRVGWRLTGARPRRAPIAQMDRAAVS